jgi:hypothetical protein
MIEHCIQPSYRNELYRVKVALTRESPISCFCDCKEGAEIDARHACVHMAPTIYLLNLFLFDGLADNLLYELSARPFLMWAQKKLSDHRHLPSQTLYGHFETTSWSRQSKKKRRKGIS